MTTTLLPEPDANQQEDLAPLVAKMLDGAARGYADFWGGIHFKPSSEQDEAIGCEAVREQGATFATLLAYASRLIGDKTPDLDGEEFPPPSGVMKALNNLQNSYTFMATIQSYQHLLNQPLVPWEDIRAELEKSESREWMKTALAAY
jgi:hypothetical protein